MINLNVIKKTLEYEAQLVEDEGNYAKAKMRKDRSNKATEFHLTENYTFDARTHTLEMLKVTDCPAIKLNDLEEIHFEIKHVYSENFKDGNCKTLVLTFVNLLSELEEYL